MLAWADKDLEFTQLHVDVCQEGYRLERLTDEYQRKIEAATSTPARQQLLASEMQARSQKILDDTQVIVRRCVAQGFAEAKCGGLWQKAFTYCRNRGEATRAGRG